MMDGMGMADGAAHAMAGIPTWMAIGAVGVIILASHLLLTRDGDRAKGGSERAGGGRTNQKGEVPLYSRLGLLGVGPLKRMVRLSFFPILVQSLSILIFLGILGAGIFGSQRYNIATVLTWTWWWALLIFVILVVGKGFCAICPWEGLASLVTSLSLRSRIKQIGFELKWPEWGRNLYPALILFVILTWFELGYDATHSPSTTAIMGMAMAGMAILSAMVFEKRGYCRYACLVGRVSGLYAQFSPLELRPTSRSVCNSCQTVDCVKGNDTATGCPTGLFPGHILENTYCTLCTECIRGCPHDNLDINMRPPATDLLRSKRRYRWDEAVMAMVLLALTSFHGMTMTQNWASVTDWLRVQTGLGQLPVFTALMVVLVLLPLVVFWIGAEASRLLAGDSSATSGWIFRYVANAVLPVALFYHLAHNGMHFFTEAQNLIPLLSDPLGFGWNLFGTAGIVYAPLLSLQTIWWIQVALIVTGHIFSVAVASRIGRTLFTTRRIALRGLTPLVFTMVLYSSFSIWLIAQPMVMRSGM